MCVCCVLWWCVCESVSEWRESVGVCWCVVCVCVLCVVVVRERVCLCYECESMNFLYNKNV